MRRTIAKIPYRASTTPAAFSTSSSGGGSGRGRGAGSPFRFTADSPTDSNNSKSEGGAPPPPPHGHGRGRGKPLPSSPVLPSFSSFLQNDDSKPPNPLGRGQSPKPNSKMPNLFVDTQPEKPLPESIVNVLSGAGAGRGKPVKAPAPQSEKPKEENRHLRKQQRRPQSPVSDSAAAAGSSLSNEDKVKKAVEILSRGDPEAASRGAASAASRGGRGGGERGGRGRGRGRGRGGGRGGERGTNESEDDLYFGDPADEEKVAQKLGPEVMSQLTEGLEEMKSRVLPSPYDDALWDALDTNLRIECEPEFLMEEFGTNPDIDEKPPIALRDALEKMKPFLMAYEGIESQEEWEEIIEETMKRVPLIKEIVDYYSGPDRVTAKEQQQELERVAETLPASAPSSIKNFTKNAVLSLQSNPGWGFDKKCQFMDKLVWEVSQQYK